MVLKVGATGTVSGVERDGEIIRAVIIDLDEPFAQDGCNGGWSFYLDCDPLGDPLPYFNKHMKVIDH